MTQQDIDRAFDEWVNSFEKREQVTIAGKFLNIMIDAMRLAFRAGFIRGWNERQLAFANQPKKEVPIEGV